MAKNEIDVSGTIELPHALETPGRLVVTIEVTALADAKSNVLARREYRLDATGKRTVSFTISYPTTPERTEIFARFLHHEGDDLRRGDAINTVSAPLQMDSKDVKLFLFEL